MRDETKDQKDNVEEILDDQEKFDFKKKNLRMYKNKLNPNYQ